MVNPHYRRVPARKVEVRLPHLSALQRVTEESGNPVNPTVGLVTIGDGFDSTKRSHVRSNGESGRPQIPLRILPGPQKS